jgi:methionyl-tRNA formyltransferase
MPEIRNTNKIVFFGTSEFAVPALEALKKEDYEIAAVITNPDEPVGRKKVLTPPPVKVVAEKYGIKILQPEKLRNNPEFVEQLKNLLNAKRSTLNASIGVVAAYGKIIPAEIINLPRLGILNIHPSLLPKYRGPTPIQTTILNGEKETGVTIIKIDEEVDHGPILANYKIQISNDKNFQELQNNLAKLGAELLIKILPDYLAGKITPQPQDHSQATFTKKFTRDDARINWNKTAEEIDRQIRALNPEPGVWTTWNGKILKILEAEVTGERSGQNGQVSQDENKTVVGTAKGLIVLKIIQPEGKKSMSAENFVRGNQDFIGAILE